MTRRLLAAALALAAMLLPVAASAQESAPALPFTDLTRQFADFADASAGLADADRVAEFKQKVAPLFPGFYAPRGRDPARYDAQIARALAGFPAIREKYAAAAAAFAAAFESAGARFRRHFPDFTLTMPVYLLHSLGEMDGGTRQIEGREVAVFGADVIAQIHDETTIGPFLDHELFHLYHARFFGDCDPLWCALWQEGMAVYVASRINPGASDRQLLLTIPRPIRPEVDAHLREAVCLTRAKLDSTDPQDYAGFFQFQGSGKPTGLPPRFGYYIGYRVASMLGKTMPLRRLARLPAAKVHPLIVKALGEMATC